jgi:hypothetical protein
LRKLILGDVVGTEVVKLPRETSATIKVVDPERGLC